jgi:hypothetical protein
MRSLYVPQVNMKRTFFYSSWVPISTTTDGFWRSFGIAYNQIPNNAELSAVFAEFRINAVKFTLLPSFSSFDGAMDNSTSPVLLTQAHVYVCYDKYNTIAPAGTYGLGTLNTFLDQEGVRLVRDTNKPIITYTKRPTYFKVDGNGMLPVLRPSTWQRTDGAVGLNHQCTQVYINTSDSVLNVGQMYQVFATVYLSLKNQR